MEEKRVRLNGFTVSLSLWIIFVSAVSLACCLIASGKGPIAEGGQTPSEPANQTSPQAVNRPPMIVILIRHAEKHIDPNNPDDKNPDLSEAGRARARGLARMFGGAGVGAIYATEYKRTQQTVKPLADKLGLTVTNIEAKKTAELVKQIRSQKPGQIVFVAGHNTTVPEIIAALGGPQLPMIPEEEFDNLFILSTDGTGTAKLLKMKYHNLAQ